MFRILLSRNPRKKVFLKEEAVCFCYSCPSEASKEVSITLNIDGAYILAVIAVCDAHEDELGKLLEVAYHEGCNILEGGGTKATPEER